MIVWGGENSSHVLMNTGGRYNPATDSWTATSTTNAPSARVGHSAVWTGNEMIVWGGTSSTTELNTGGSYNPVTDTWTATGTVNAPTARQNHTAVWTGSEMIVWGGSGCGGNCTFNSGSRYNPGTDSWTPTSTINVAYARWGHTAVWAGSEMIVWGGTDEIVNHTYLHTGGRYNPANDSWMPTSLMNVPLGRIAHTAVWTGSEMIVWGGVDETFNLTNTGGRYNPSTDGWTATSLADAPSARYSHTAVWTGSQMIVWSGFMESCDVPNGGARYEPITDSWTPTNTANPPVAREYHTAVWTGSQMIVWGGEDYNLNALNTGGRYCAQPAMPIVQSVVSRKAHGNAGSFDINLPLSGTPGIECRSGGATNDYTIVVTFNANVSVNGNPQAAVTSGVGIVGSGGVSNGGRVTIAGNVVTVPLTNVANAQTINVTLYGVNGSTNIVIPMSILIGDTNANGIVNASDVSLTKSQVGVPVSGSNFREDVNANGLINSVDVALVKAKVGTALP
jgi:N-acetylneuraminic acid mutarotase